MNLRDDFIEPKCCAAMLDTYVVRRSILLALREALPKLKGTLLDVGCGFMPYREVVLDKESNVTKYVGLDLADNLYGSPDLEWDGSSIPLPDKSVDSAMATEVFEHCPDFNLVLSEISRVLKPTGYLFFTVPFVWPLHNVPNDEYRYTPFSLRRHLLKAGFEDCEIKAMGGWDATLAQVLGLWVRRRPLSAAKRWALSLIFLPICRFLLAHDYPDQQLGESSLVTGFSGTARKP